MKVKIRELRNEDIIELCNLYGEAFGSEALARWQKRWKWEFVDNPACKVMQSRIFVAEDSNQGLIGCVGSFPVELKIGDKLVPYLYGCDFLVAKASRKKNIGNRLVQAYAESARKIATSFFHTDVSVHILKKFAFQAVYSEPVYIRLVNFLPVLKLIKKSKTLPKFVSGKPVYPLIRNSSFIANGIIMALNYWKHPKNSSNCEIKEVIRVDSEFDDLWERYSKKFPIIVKRDSRFIKWRFIDDPVFQHTLLSIRNKNGFLNGYIDVRVSDLGDIKVGHIMDIFCDPDSNEVIEALICDGMKVLSERKVDLIKCIGLHPKIRTHIQKYLYWKPSMMEVPALVLWKGDPKLEKFVHDKSNWHLSLADGDGGFML
jgi:predicted N-acetyltransferase YhbS